MLIKPTSADVMIWQMSLCFLDGSTSEYFAHYPLISKEMAVREGLS